MCATRGAKNSAVATTRPGRPTTERACPALEWDSPFLSRELNKRITTSVSTVAAQTAQNTSADNQKSHNHFDSAIPAATPKMVRDGRHPEDALAAQALTELNLQNPGNGSMTKNYAGQKKSRISCLMMTATVPRVRQRQGPTSP